MSGPNPAGTIPDYVVDPSIRKTMDEWAKIFYPEKRPWWFSIAKQAVKFGFAIKDGRIIYDPSFYRK